MFSVFNIVKRNQDVLVSFSFQILVNCLCCFFACTHCADHGCCACNSTSPPARTPHLEVAPVSSFATTVPFLSCSRPSEPLKIIGLGDVPMAITTTLAGIVNSKLSTGTGLLLPD